VTTTNAHQFVQAILAACNAGHDDVAFEAATASIRRALVAFGSETPDNLACAAQVDFGASAGRGYGPERTIGLRLAGANVLVSDIMHSAEGSAIPASVRSAFPELTQEAWDAVGRLVTLILLSLECAGKQDSKG
jgi:hypothetical protein